jgi:hypothetical protein
MSTKSKSKALAAVAALIGTLLFAPSAGAFDTTPPTLVSATVSPVTLPESGGTVTVTAQVTSAYELTQTPLFIFGQMGYTKNFSCTSPPVLRMTLVAGDSKNGTFRCESNFSAPLKPGIYKLTFFPLTDAGGNTTDFITTKYSIAVEVPTPTPTPTPSATSTPTPTPDAASQLTALQGQVAALLVENASLKSQVAQLAGEKSALAMQLKRIKNQLKKICTVRSKPKGC